MRSSDAKQIQLQLKKKSKLNPKALYFSKMMNPDETDEKAVLVESDVGRVDSEIVNGKKSLPFFFLNSFSLWIFFFFC